ncbi:MAG: LysM domain-containing protein [Desulfitobacteriaceae bacterium]|nr:LysM domain-containing protein [Desulfitobacteriaceae bacterium]MDD4346480.1 LysM domain-containing protein [Desulfitobacteriaceae bacterium]MDD4401262.1 LysM domain-containing protein [Desulfitobacteriaceae bacterium]
MFFGKRQTLNGYVEPTMMAATMPDSQMRTHGKAGMVGMPCAPEVAGYAGPGHFLHGAPGMPGCDPCGYVGHPGYDMCCPPYGLPDHGNLECDLEPQPCPMPHVYIVRKGDTVYKIAQRYDLDWRELAGYNHLGNPDLIYPGQRLEIPPCR